VNQYVVIKQVAEGRKQTYGPVTADSPVEAISLLASGNHPRYIATGFGRYHAIPLDVWQDGTFDWTKARGPEAVFA
jgi:hypothetical protein